MTTSVQRWRCLAKDNINLMAKLMLVRWNCFRIIQDWIAIIYYEPYRGSTSSVQGSGHLHSNACTYAQLCWKIKSSLMHLVHMHEDTWAYVQGCLCMHKAGQRRHGFLLFLCSCASSQYVSCTHAQEDFKCEHWFCERREKGESLIFVIEKTVNNTHWTLVYIYMLVGPTIQ